MACQPRSNKGNLTGTECWRTKEFHNSPKWSIEKVYLSGDELTVRVAILSPLHALGTGIKSRSQETFPPLHVHAFRLHLEYMRPHPKWAGILKVIG